VEEARPFAEDDIEDIEACDVFVAFTAPPPQSGRGGRHVETGYAYALHRDRQFWDGEAGDLTTPLVIVGPAENIFHSLPEFQRFPTWAAFLVDLDAKHTPAQFCDDANPATGRRHREIPGDPPYHCAAAPAPRQWEYPTCTSHPTAERTHWNGTAWVEPPDGEAMEPRIPLPGWSETDDQLCAGLCGWTVTQETPAVSRHAFNEAVDKTLHRCLSISDQRGGEYQDTWSLDNEVTIFLDATLRAIGIGPGGPGPLAIEPYTPEEKRLLIVASLIDVKLSRMLGPWKQDTIDDTVNYLGAYASWREAYENPEGTA
jgi:hypothetical protein